MKLIPLTQGKFAKVDDEDYDWLNQWKWLAHKSKCGKRFTAERNQRIKGERQKLYIMSRVILNTDDKNIFVDHINHDSLDNRRCNLRTCTPMENSRNMSPKSNSSSKYLGVSFTKNRIKRPWRVSICVNKKRLFVKMCETELEAAKIYDEVAKKHFGEFANLNFKN